MTNAPQERRRRPRVSTMMLCDLCPGDHNPQIVRIRDMSELGLRIAAPFPLSVEQRIRVHLHGGCDWVRARVVWTQGLIAGIAFAHAIDLPRVSERPPGAGGIDPDMTPSGRRAA